MHQPLVSIIIPVYNDALFIIETLVSVVNQNYTNWECVIVNDGSSDNSENLIQDFIKSESRFKYIFKENSGVAATRNLAISKAKGEYILPLDSDDIIEKDYLKNAIEVFTKNPDVKLVYCKAVFFGEQTGKFNLKRYKYEDLILQNSIFCSAFFKKSDFIKTEGYDTNLKIGLEDWEFWIRFLNTNDQVVCLNQVHFYYRIKNKSRNKIHDDAVKVKEIQDYIYTKHKDKYDQLLFGDYPKINKLYNLLDTNQKFNSIRESLGYKIYKIERELKKIFKI